ncbi:MAG: hypothetical protein DCC67_09215 [Planctomycetota bacterium]|nr:MAG: hypothetical protein DCC67_09215 [Planctomycetota bacterium]
MRVVAGALLTVATMAASRGSEPSIPADFPRFVVPGKEQQMDVLRALFWLHYQPAGPLIPLWDEWMAKSTLWPARGEGRQLGEMRRRWAAALSSRTMNEEGYVHTRQHDGPAHAEGWPFPFWSHAGGAGWHFRPIGVAGYEAPTVSNDGWTVEGAGDRGVREKGWTVELTAPRASMTSPLMSIPASLAPWVRLNWWAAGLEHAQCRLEWTTADAPQYGAERMMYFAPPAQGVADAKASPGGAESTGPDTSQVETRTMIPVFRHPEWKGTITGLRLSVEDAASAVVVVKSIHTACDTRHNINNLNFIRGCHDYFMWSRDLNFLRCEMERIRRAMRYVQREFQTRERKCIYTTWPGHEGRSGVRWTDGAKHIIPGQGIGSNYWDLLPFGGEDALATLYYYDALHDLADLEAAIARHSEWNISAGADPFDAAELKRHAADVKAYSGQRFWNAATGRFGTRDLDGNLHDYGFTFLNTEAVYYGLATEEQARSIHAWLNGDRVVEGDASTGADIYHWRFGPRSTTRRNVDYYVWNWSAPESIPFGYQVQDGGAVLGWSYHDMMARLQTAGPDDAANRLEGILAWFAETQAAGGYRSYYAADPARGTLQGGNVAGGLGLDREFFESVLVPQVMLYGFLGFRPAADGFAINPRLPKDWPELTVSRIHLHEYVLDVTAKRDGTARVVAHHPGRSTLTVRAAPGVHVTAEGVDVEVVPIGP